MSGRTAPPTAVSDERIATIERHQRDQSAFFTRLRGGIVLEEPDLFVALSGHPVAWTNNVLGARLAPDRADARIEDVRALLRRRGLPGTWWVTPLTLPTDLDRRLRRHGFTAEHAIPWMALDLDRIVPPPVPSGLRIHRVDSPSFHAAFLAAMTAGFGMDGLERRVIDEGARGAGYDPGGPWVRFVGMLDGQPVASAGLQTFAGVAGIYNVATDPSVRRRGFGAALTFAALRHAAELGLRLAVLGSSEMGRGVYERLGFVELCSMTEWVWRP